MRDTECGLELAPDRVAASFLVAEEDGDLVGRASIRHELNEFLVHVGGHIGFAVRPAYRRRGVGGEILRQSLIVARAHGVDAALVTCDEDNVASATVIERQGGVFQDTVLDSQGTRMRRYWIA
jgi:predicted acetyltransferase